MKKMLIIISIFYIFLLNNILLSSENELNTDTKSIFIFKKYTEGTKSGTLYKGIEYIDIYFTKDKNYSLNLEGWTSGYLSNTKENENIDNNELSSAYLQYNLENYPITYKLGRFYLNEGIAKMEQVDGLYSKLSLKNNFTLSLYGGNNEIASNNIVYGGRLSKKWNKNSEIGLSYIKSDDNISSSSLYRKEGSFDIYYKILNNAYLLGNINYNFASGKIFSYNYIVDYFPNSYLTITEEYKKDYLKFIFPTSTPNIFPNIDNYMSEKVRTLFDINYADDHSLAVEYQTFSFSEGRRAHYYGGELRYRMLTENTYGLAFHRMYAGKSNVNYNVSKQFFKVNSGKKIHTFEAIQLFYSDPLNDYESNSNKQEYQFTITNGYYFSENSLITGTLEYKIKSYYQDDLSGIIKINYSF